MSNAYLKQYHRQRYGGRCMLCQRSLQKKKQSLHHRKPKKNGGENTKENTAITCMECQNIIHHFEYGTEPYTVLDNLISKNLKKYDKYKVKK